MKSGILIQARMSSNRLPGKVLMEIGGEPALSLLVKRCKRVKKVDQVIVVTSDQKEDDAIEKAARRCDVPCFRGSLDDVLKRYIDAAEHYGIGQIVRVCADGPFRSPEIIEKSFEQHIEEGNDYTDANGRDLFITSGIGAEIATFDALRKSFQKSKSPEDLEHVTRYIRQNPAEFKKGAFKNNGEYWIEGLSLLIDTPADYEKILSFLGRLPRNVKLEDTGIPEMRSAFHQLTTSPSVHA